MQVQQEYYNQDRISLTNYINLSNQSKLSPEIIFINSPLTINKSTYFKLFVNLNYNPNMVNKQDMKKVKTYDEIDFKLYNQTDMKEIKPIDKIPTKLTINNNNNSTRLNVFEYNIPISIFNENSINLSFGISYKENLISYTGTGLISILNQTHNSLNVDQEIVLYFRSYDFVTNSIDWNSHAILSAKTTIDVPPLDVSNNYEYLAKINLIFSESIPDEILNNKRVYEIISQIKNNKIFPYYSIESIAFKDGDDFKKYYHGDFKWFLDESSKGDFSIKPKNTFFLDKQSKIMNIEPSDTYHQIAFNPYSWAENQAILLNLLSFGERITIQIKLKTFSHYFSWNQNTGFVYDPKTTRKYKLEQLFWDSLPVLDDDRLWEELNKYEIL